MSYNKEIKINCPKCKKCQNFKVWQSINITEDSYLHDNVFSGEIFTFICDECGTKSFITYPMIYHDFNRKFFIYFNPDGNFENMIETEGFITKKTSDYLEMLEMIRIFEDGVDEKRIKLAKENLKDKLKGAKSELLKDINNIYYSGVDGKKVSFFIPEIKSKIDIEW